MFSISDSGTKTGKSSIPGSWSIHDILEALQKHDTGQAELSLSSPNKTPHNPQRAIPWTPVVIAGLARCIHRCVMSCSIFSNSEMRRRCCGMRKDVVRDARLSWVAFSGLRRKVKTQRGNVRVPICCAIRVLLLPNAVVKRVAAGCVCLRAAVVTLTSHIQRWGRKQARQCACARACEEAAARTCKRLLITDRISLSHRCNYMWRGTLRCSQRCHIGNNWSPMLSRGYLWEMHIDRDEEIGIGCQICFFFYISSNLGNCLIVFISSSV